MLVHKHERGYETDTWDQSDAYEHSCSFLDCFGVVGTSFLLKCAMLMSPVVCVSTIFIGMVGHLLYVLLLLSDHWNYGHNPRTKHRRHERCVSFENHVRKFTDTFQRCFFSLESLFYMGTFQCHTKLNCFLMHFKVVFKHDCLLKLATQRHLSDFHKSYPLLLLTRDIKFKIGKHIVWVEHNLNFIILPSHNCI